MSSSKWVIGIDVGGTRMKGGLWSSDGQRGWGESRPTRREDGPATIIERLVTFAQDLSNRVPAGTVVGLGVAATGFVDENRGVAVRSMNLGWSEVPLRSLLTDRLRLPVTVGHDVRSGALAEGLVGAARGCHDFVFLTWGTDIGGAIVIAGEPYHGATGASGELGHIVVDPDGPRCLCGQDGCLGALAPALALERRYEEVSGERVAAQELIRRAQIGDQLAGNVWRDAVRFLGIAIANYATILDPERIVVGGGLAAIAGPSLFQLVERGIPQPSFRGIPPVVPAALGEDSGSIGAALRSWLSLGVSRPALAQHHQQWTVA